MNQRSAAIVVDDSGYCAYPLQLIHGSSERFSEFRLHSHTNPTVTRGRKYVVLDDSAVREELLCNGAKFPVAELQGLSKRS